ncbi:ATP12-domain-containing protein [Clavulina sp. PMI_390]|nr:ATP12-domain-containing protein [Clavulina sp. PMI_390]
MVIETPVLKRFWKQVHITEADGKFRLLTIMLDKRTLKTPDGRPLRVPSSKRGLAAVVAQEWEAQEKVTKHHALPATSLVCNALDLYEDAGTRADKCADLLRYLDTDTICFQASYPHQLVTLQTEHWDPLFAWVREEFGVTLERYEDMILMEARQSEECKRVMREALEGMDGLTLAAMERAVYYSKSFIIGLAMARGKLDAERAAQAAHVEVQSQILRWGEVEDTHDVDYRDIRRHLASAALAFAKV